MVLGLVLMTCAWLAYCCWLSGGRLKRILGSLAQQASQLIPVLALCGGPIVAQEADAHGLVAAATASSDRPSKRHLHTPALLGLIGFH
ncbi:hypothetical protein V8C86DRAFT_624014 [Haematococcus lacustris]